MAKTKQEHYVPQFYLRSFADDTGYVWVYDKPEGKQFRTGVSNVAAESRFYDLPGSGDQPVEQRLAGIEARVSPLLRELAGLFEASGEVRDDIRSQVAEFIALQLLRTRKYRNMINELYPKAANDVRDWHSADISGVDVGAIIDGMLQTTSEAETHEASMFAGETPKMIADTFANMAWVLGAAAGDLLYTSDSPVVCHRYGDWSGASYMLAQPDTEVVFPLAPDRLLLLRGDVPVKRESTPDGACVVLRAKDVKQYNRLQVRGSHRQVYCRRKEFNVAERLCTKDPALRDPNRQQVSMTRRRSPEGERPILSPRRKW
jgi:hypothetical protein